MQYSQMKLEVVRTIFSNEINEVVIVRSTVWEGAFFTAVVIKNRKVIEFVLNLLSKNNTIASDDTDLLGVNTIGKYLVLLFRYFPERRYESYCSLTMMELSSFQKAAKTFLEKCLASELPREFLWLAIQKENMSIHPYHSIYFNYFLDFRRLQHLITKKDLADKAAYFVKGMLVQYYQKQGQERRKAYPRAAELFIRKQEIGSFVSLVDVYEDILFLIQEQSEAPKGLLGLWKKKKEGLRISLEWTKAVLVAVIVCITFSYVYSECKVRKIPAFLYQEEVQSTVYEGVNRIGRQDLTDGHVS